MSPPGRIRISDDLSGISSERTTFSVLQINDMQAIACHAGGNHVHRSRLRRIGHVGNANPVRDCFVAVSMTDAGRVLIVSKDAAAIGRNGNALDGLLHGNRSDETTFREIEHAHASGTDIGRVTAPAIA